MNQILFTNNNNKRNNKVDTKKIVMFFSLMIIFISITIVIMKIYGIYKKKINEKENVAPQLSIIRESEESEEVTIKVMCEDGIQYLSYIWNNGDENRINLNGSTTFERMVEIPKNIMNNLTVKVVSLNGTTTERTEIFEKTTGNIGPKIDSISIVNNKLQLKISDDIGIDYMTYKWENEGLVRIDAEEGAKEMFTEIDIQRGTYKLYITVVDTDGNEESLSKLVTGVNEPQISVIKYGNKVNVSVTHDRGFKKIEFIVNNTLYVYDEEYSKYDKNKTTVEFDFPLQEGENLIQIKAYSLEMLSDESEDILENYASKIYTGKCTYRP